MIKSAENGNISNVNFCLKYGANSFNKTMATASKYGHLEIVKLMLIHGADEIRLAMSISDYFKQYHVYNFLYYFERAKYNI